MTRRSHVSHKQKKYSKSYFQPAFGLVEVVLAMFILTTGLMVVMLPAIKTIQYTKQNRQAVLAANLAQEGVEMIRNIRDTKFAMRVKGDATLDKAFDMDAANRVKSCSIDYKGILSNCTGFTKEDGAISLVNGFYESSTANPVFWRRAVLRRVNKIVSGVDNVRYDVTVQVVWGTGSFKTDPRLDECTRSNQCVFSQATFTNWNYWSE